MPVVNTSGIKLLDNRQFINIIIKNILLNIEDNFDYDSIPVTDASEFKFEESTGAITKFIGTSTEINIPKKIYGITVESIGKAAFEEKEITAVNIPEGVTLIGSNAFLGCKNLINVSIPDSVTSIDGWAFGECKSLEHIHIPEGVTEIGNGAFARCNSLESIELPDDNEYYTIVDGILFSKDLTEICCYPAGKSGDQYTIPDSAQTISHSAFSGCHNLTNIQIPDGVQKIGGSAFSCCFNLENINIPDSVNYISMDMFSDCTNLKDITIPYGVEKIYDSAFEGCTSLTEVVIPDSVTRIGQKAFYGCTSLKNIDLPDNIKFIGGGGDGFYNESKYEYKSIVLRCTEGSETEKTLGRNGNYEDNIEYY